MKNLTSKEVQALIDAADDKLQDIETGTKQYKRLDMGMRKLMDLLEDMTEDKELAAKSKDAKEILKNAIAEGTKYVYLNGWLERAGYVSNFNIILESHDHGELYFTSI